MSPKTAAQKSSKTGTATRTAVKGFTDEERAAMKERARELQAEARRGPRPRNADGERDVLAKIAEMPSRDRAMAERLHAIVKASAPDLVPRTWYGMPAYARDGHVVCFFQGAHKFKARYATFGFSDKANLDDGTMWPVAFALKAVDRRRRGEDRRAREESGELRRSRILYGLPDPPTREWCGGWAISRLDGPSTGGAGAARPA